MNITGEIGERIKIFLPVLFCEPKCTDFMFPGDLHSSGQVCRIFPLIANGMAKEKRKGENCLGML